MRFFGICFVSAGVLAVTSVFLMPQGCEETLESCAPCGQVSDGAFNVSGDPRLDGTIEAVQRARALFERVQSDYQTDLAALAAAFDASGKSPRDVVRAVEKQLVFAGEYRVTVIVNPVGCWVDTQLAATKAAACEAFFDCYVSADCRASKLTRTCTGYCEGELLDSCAKKCQSASGVLNESCEGACNGLCFEAAPRACDGRCFGQCDGFCTAYAADGSCAGFCSGACTGSCDSFRPAPCDGPCLGECLTDLPTGQGACLANQDDASSISRCLGVCRDGNCLGNCRGNYRVSCNSSSNCAAVKECRETASALAWAALHCEPAEVEVGISFDKSYSKNKGPIIKAMSVLEDVLRRGTGHYAALSILADGIDVSKALSLGDLADNSTDHPEIKYLDDASLLALAAVPRQKSRAPLFALKARVKHLSQVAISGDFEIAEGAIRCVVPAFDEAFAVLDSIVPVEMQSAGEGEELGPKRDCLAAGSSFATCAFEMIDIYGALMRLGAQ